MSDYIKREDAKRALNNGLSYMRAFGVNRCLTMIDEVPSADVVERSSYESMEHTVAKLNEALSNSVEVVRCKDCKHNYRRTTWNHGARDNPSCKYTDYVRDNDFYCSFGERSDA